MRQGIDIIIPIYNAYDDLKKCYQSILKYTDLTLDRLILINDKSPDERIHEFLSSINKSGIIYLNNEENMGFSNNVNRGMLYSDDRDVILLNSDTIVTKNWVDKIYTCAYSKQEIGTVTPLSNSATLCSVPIMCQDNNIPEGLTVDDMAEIVERCSVRAYPRITVAVGFCMFIKRETIIDVGLFDAKTFERGYGEENDFCNRAEQLGYIHVMCDDTFIYHKGTMSFNSVEKQKLIEAHDRILQDRYPVQMRNNHLYCVTNPDQYIRDNIIPHIDLKNGKKNVLYLVHLDFREDSNGHVGGTQFHVRDLTMNLKDEYNIFVVSRDLDYLRLTIYIGEKRHSYKFKIGKQSDFFAYHDEKLKRIFSTILDVFDIDTVHIHHVDGLSLDMFYCAKERNIGLIGTMHDFNAICPNLKLINHKGHYCAGCCDLTCEKECLNSKKEIAVTTNYLRKWRDEFRKAYMLCDSIVTPSEVAKDIVISVFPELAEKMIVIEHGTEIGECVADIFDEKTFVKTDDIAFYFEKTNRTKSLCVGLNGWAILKNVDNSNVDIYLAAYYNDRYVRAVKMDKSLRKDVAESHGVSFYEYSGVGCNIYLQGDEQINRARILAVCNGQSYVSNEVIELSLSKVAEDDKIHVAFIGGLVPEKGSSLASEMIRFADQDKFEWYIIGDIGDEKLSNIEQDNLFKIGRYKKEELPGLIEDFGIDVACILSIWPETYCYTLSESILCNVPVLSLDIGAGAPRIKKNNYGWVIDKDASASEIVTFIEEKYKDVDGFTEVKNNAYAYKERTLCEMCYDYKVLYSSIKKEKCLKKSQDQRLILDAWMNAHNNISNSDVATALEQNQVLIHDLKRMLEEQTNENKLIKASKSYRFSRKIARVVPHKRR